MDYLNNKNVEKALREVDKIIHSVDLKTKKVTWDEKYKGIDDYLLCLKKERK